MIDIAHEFMDFVSVANNKVHLLYTVWNELEEVIMFSCLVELWISDPFFLMIYFRYKLVVSVPEPKKRASPTITNIQVQIWKSLLFFISPILFFFGFEARLSVGFLDA